MSDVSRFATVGRIRRAHGIRGELVVEPLTSEPDTVFAPGRSVLAGTADGALWRDRATGEPRALTIRAARPFKDALLVTLDGIADRTEAERWRGRHLLVPAGEIAAPGEGEVYLRDLEGMRVLDEHGAALGAVHAWYELPQGILLEVRTARGDVQVPFNEAFVRRVDREARALTLAIPEELYETAASRDLPAGGRPRADR